MEKRIAHRRSATQIWPFLVLLLALSVPGASAQDQRPIPGGATPGGQLPQSGEKWALPDSRESIFPIPPVIDRPLGLEEGPRLVVQRFTLEGVADYPERGISVPHITGMLQKRVARQPAGGYTINQLQEVANEIARYYRENGFILAQCFVPEQEVENGVVVIRVLEGRLGRMQIEGNVRYSVDRLLRPFDDLIGKPVEKGPIESGLLHLTDYPGLTVFGVFGPGDKVGTTNLMLKIQEEDRVEWGVSTDNHGIELSGEYRTQVNWSVNNLTGGADRLYGYVLQTFDPTNGTYGAINYERPILDMGWTIGAGYTRNAYELGQQLADLGIEGETDIGSVFARKSFIRSRTLNWYGIFDLSIKSATTERAGIRLAKDDLSVLSAELGFDHVDSRFRGIHTGNLEISLGFDNFLGSNAMSDPFSSRVGGSGERAGAEFEKYVLRYQRLQRLSPNHALLFRMEGQHTEDLLVSLEQLSLGGPHSVRAYGVAEQLVDKGGFGSLEWIINAPGFANRPAFNNRTWGEIFQLSFFYDYAGGKNLDPFPNEEETVDLKGYGVGLQLLVPGKWFARVDVATPQGDPEPSDGDDPQVYFRFDYDF